MQKLNESSYITINIKDIIDNQTPADNGGAPAPTPTGGDKGGTNGGAPEAPQNGGTQTPAGGQQPAAKKTKIDWSTELQKRLEANRALSKDARVNDSEIEDKFWMEFYTEVFGDLAKEVNNIRQLKLDIKKLGYKKKDNPILAFLAQAYVKKTFIQAGLINNNTYDVLRLMFGKRLVADSEMLAKNNYNIIYCLDFWKKSTEEMKQYLELQKNVLSTNAKVYTQSIQERNIRTFLPPKCSSMTSGSATLNSIREVQRTLNLGKNQLTRDQGTGQSTSKSANGGIDTLDGQTSKGEGQATAENPVSTSEELTSAVAKVSSIGTVAAFASALQYIAFTTGSKTAAAALGEKAFSSVSVKDLSTHSASIQNVLKGLKFGSQESLEAFIKALISERDRKF